MSCMKWVNTRMSPRHNTTILTRLEGEMAMTERRGNVSSGGFCFESDRELEVGKHVDLLFRLPGAGIWLRAQGEVAGCERQDGWVAVRGKFTEIDVGDAAIFTQWLRSLANLRRVA